MKTKSLSSSLLLRIQAALQEDGAYHDVTTQALPGAGSHKVNATLIAHAEGVVSGISVIPLVFKTLDRQARVILKKRDGDVVRPGTIIAIVRAKASAVLGGERVMLNLVTHLSGVATLTRRFVDVIKNKNVSVVDTRKTMPLWRDLERAAVRHGRGVNHRFNLSDAVLAKDNHLAYLLKRGLRAHGVYGLDSAVRRRRPKPTFVAIEAKNKAEVWEAIKARPDIILLDNMAPDRLKGCILFIKAARRGLQTTTPYIEVSGGVTLENAAQLAALGVDRISIGSLTHSAPSLDMSMEVI